MSGKFSNCCCTPPGNCLASQLSVSKKRLGFECLYDQAWSGWNKLRFLSYDLSYDFVRTGASPSSQSYAGSVAITDTKTGELTYSDSGSRSAAITAINTMFGECKDYTSGSTHSTSGYTIVGGGINYHWSRDITPTFTYHADDATSIIAATIVLNYSQTYDSPFGALDFAQTTTIVISVADDYDDTTLLAEVEDLLANYNTGTANGVLGLPDNALVVLAWNEAYSTLGYSAGDGNVAIDLTTLSGYTSLTPTLSTSTYDDPAAYFGGAGAWWQHAGGGTSNGEHNPPDPDLPEFSVYHCTFEDDSSMPVLSLASRDMSRVWKSAYRFGVTTPVCGQWPTRNTALVDGTDLCVISTTTSGYEVLYTPDYDVTSVRMVTYALPPSFTAPGYLTAGDCPCSNAP